HQKCLYEEAISEEPSALPIKAVIHRAPKRSLWLLITMKERLVEWINKCRKEQNAVTRNMVDLQLIVKAFKCCGVSVKMDGTEDDQVFDYELLNENPTDENDENSEVINGDDSEGEIYEEVEGDNNVWE
ncbi:13296_t:CDS:2, partial [Cetraspora pellucida]